jgi:hypothetical protein
VGLNKGESVEVREIRERVNVVEVRTTACKALIKEAGGLASVFWIRWPIVEYLV